MFCASRCCDCCWVPPAVGGSLFIILAKVPLPQPLPFPKGSVPAASLSALCSLSALGALRSYFDCGIPFMGAAVCGAWELSSGICWLFCWNSSCLCCSSAWDFVWAPALLLEEFGHWKYKCPTPHRMHSAEFFASWPRFLHLQHSTSWQSLIAVTDETTCHLTRCSHCMDQGRLILACSFVVFYHMNPQLVFSKYQIPNWCTGLRMLQ